MADVDSGTQIWRVRLPSMPLPQRRVLASSRIHEVAVSLLCNMWRFNGVPDLAREGIKTWKRQVPWWAINLGGNISNAEAPGINKHGETSQALGYRHDFTMRNRLLFHTSLQQIWPYDTSKCVKPRLMNADGEKANTQRPTRIHPLINLGEACREARRGGWVRASRGLHQYLNGFHSSDLAS